MQTFDRVYQAHNGEIYKFLYSILGSEAEAREVAQETFLAFLKEIRANEMPLSKERPWLYRVARNKAYNTQRSKRYTESFQQHQEKGSTLEAKVSVERTTPESQLVKKQEQEKIRGIFTHMKERERSLLQYYTAGLSYVEIASAMGVERSTIGKALARAKASFKILYEGWPPQ